MSPFSLNTFIRQFSFARKAMFHVPVEKHGVNGHLRQKGKIAELALGYGGSVGALTAMGALDMGLSEDELQPLVDSWRASNPNIVQFWWDVDRCVKTAIKQRTATETHGIRFVYQSGMLFIVLPSGRRLCYVKPKIGENKFCGESVTYEGVGTNKKWVRMARQRISRLIACTIFSTNFGPYDSMRSHFLFVPTPSYVTDSPPNLFSPIFGFT